MPTATLPCDKVVEIETAAELCNLILPDGCRVLEANGQLIGFTVLGGEGPARDMLIETGGEFTRVKIKGT